MHGAGPLRILALLKMPSNYHELVMSRIRVLLMLSLV